MTLIAVKYCFPDILSSPYEVILNVDAIETVDFSDNAVDISIGKRGWTCYYKDNPKLKDWLQDHLIDFRVKDNKQEPKH